MNEKPSIIYILVILWVVIGILFIGIIVQRTFDYFNYLDLRSTFGRDSFTTTVTFSYVLYTILFIIIIALSFFLAYGSFIKEGRSWIIGIILTSLLIYFVFQAIYFIGVVIIMKNLENMINNFEYVVYVLMLFFVPCLMFILTRSDVKAYFGKT